MGVTNLWQVLEDLCEKKHLTYLTGKTVAVDLSGWVVQACLCKGLNSLKNPHLRNLFFRVSRLLQLGVFPIFVMEGEMPSLKESAVKERCSNRYSDKKSSSVVSRSIFDSTLKEIADGVITEDNDTFLYGANVIFRNFSIDPIDPHVNVYDLNSAKNKLSLDRRKLVALALLLGCDYSKGVHGVGKEIALKFLCESNYDDILQRFKDWKNLSESELFPQLEMNCEKKPHCSRCGHLGSCAKHKKDGCFMCDSNITCYLSDSSKPCQCRWHQNVKLVEKWKTEYKIYKIVKTMTDFPNEEVIQEYLYYEDSVPSDGILHWSHPNFLLFQHKALNVLNWTIETINQKFLPIIVSWQLYQQRNGSLDKNSFIYKPVKILKQRTQRGVKFYEVSWKVLNENEGIPCEDIITLEYSEYFSKCYDDVVADFLSSEAELKGNKQQKTRKKKIKEIEENKKVDPGPVLCGCSYLCSPVSKQSSCRDSIDSLLEMPLWERVKAAQKIIFDKVCSPLFISHVNDKENLSIYFDKESDACSIFSPVACFEFGSFNESESSLECLSKQLHSEEAQKSPTGNVSQSFMDMVNNRSRNLCLNFSDSDDSFLSGLKQDSYKSAHKVSFKPSNCLVKDMNFPPSHLLTDSFAQSAALENKQQLSTALSPLTDKTNFSPCLLYFVHSTPVSEQKMCLKKLCPVFIKSSTPTLKDKVLTGDTFLSTPKISKSASNSVYSPLIFDSSADLS